MAPIAALQSFGKPTLGKPSVGTEPVSYMGRYIRLRTLAYLRWLGVAGQMATVLVVYFVLGFELPFGWCIAAIAASLWLNLFTVLRQ